MSSRRASALALAAAVLVGAGGTVQPEMPHPAPNVRARPADEASCERCHAAIAAEWRASLHHASFTDRDFQRSLGREPDPFCRGCHAPEKDEALGVGCITCHVTSGEGTLAVPRDAVAGAPHAVVRSEAFAGTGACARCHEFDFPDARSRRTPLAMQRTVSEHGGRSDTCATCHMKRTNGHADHRFGASRDEAFVRSAVTVVARRVEGAVEVILTPASVGHAFPTGDLFRRVRVSVGREQRFLARHFATRQEVPGVLTRVEVGDDRVLGGPRVVTFPAPAGPVRVRVAYERAEGPSEPNGAGVAVAGAIVLFDEDR